MEYLIALMYHSRDLTSRQQRREEDPLYMRNDSAHCFAEEPSLPSCVDVDRIRTCCPRTSAVRNRVHELTAPERSNVGGARTVLVEIAAKG